MTSPYTQDQLSQAFDAICDPADWKAPIAAWVSGEGVNLAVAAIQHFTATTPSVAACLNQAPIRYLIESVGYRMGPAGDH